MTTDKEETKAHEFPIELVEKELEGDATPNDLAVIQSNKVLWRKHLVEIKSRIAADMLAKKHESMAAGFMNHGAMTKFQEWKRRAVYFSTQVDKRLTQLKLELKAQNKVSGDAESKDKWGRQYYLLECILEELELIRATLENPRSESSASLADADSEGEA